MRLCGVVGGHGAVWCCVVDMGQCGGVWWTWSSVVVCGGHGAVWGSVVVCGGDGAVWGCVVDMGHCGGVVDTGQCGGVWWTWAWLVHMLAVWWCVVDMGSNGVVSARAGSVVVCGGHGRVKKIFFTKLAMWPTTLRVGWPSGKLKAIT